MTTRNSTTEASRTKPCALCNGSGWRTSTDDGNVAKMSRCDCWIQKQQTWAIEVPDFFKTARLENFRETSSNRYAIKAAAAWLKASSGDLYLAGGVGVGKTRLACSLLNERWTAGDQSARFCSVPYLFHLQLQGMDDPAKKAEANGLFDACMYAETLVLDDVGAAEKASDYSRGVIVTLYDQRLARSKRTIWTSNGKLSALKNFYQDDRLSSRIAGACGEVLEITGSDFRTAR